MLERGSHLNKAAKHHETDEKVMGSKLKDRVKRVINKLFDKELDLDHVMKNSESNEED